MWENSGGERIMSAACLLHFCAPFFREDSSFPVHSSVLSMVPKCTLKCPLIIHRSFNVMDSDFGCIFDGILMESTTKSSSKVGSDFILVSN